MAIEFGEAALLAEISAQMGGMSIDQAYNQYMTDRYKTDNGPEIGYANYTKDTPAITGNTGGSISTGTSGATPVDAWNDYVENEVSKVSRVTGGIVSGSTADTTPYSLMELEDTQDVKAVAPVSVPIAAAITAISQALGVSMVYDQLDEETKNRLIDSYTTTSGVIYDGVNGLVTAWKDEWGRILFPKKSFDAIQAAIDEENIGGEPGKDYPSLASKWSQPVVLTTNATYSKPNGTYSESAPMPFCVLHDGGTSYSYFCVSAQDLGAQVSGKYTYQSSSGSVYSSPFVINRGGYSTTLNGTPYYKYNLTSQPGSNVSGILVSTEKIDPSATEQELATIIIDGVDATGGYPEGTSESQATSYTSSTIPIAGNLATSYNPDTGELDTEPLVPVHLTENPYDTAGDTTNPTDPTDEDNPGVKTPPIPVPIPDTKPSNPDVPLTDSSVINSTLINELVEELANTLDPQPEQSSGIIPIPPLPGIVDPSTGQRSFPSIIPQSGPGFIHVYNPTPAEFVAFGTWLWVTYADATIDKILNNPFDGVIGAHELYATPNRDGRDNIRSAFLTCPTTADLVTNRYSEIDCGTVIVPEFYANYLDYSPYSQAYIYLPFIGINEVSIDDIVGHAVNIRYRIDSYSGSCIAMIFVAKDGYQNLCYQYAGSCSVEVPMAGGSQAAIKAAEMQAEAYAGAAQFSALGHLFGGIGSALMGNIGGLLYGMGGVASDYGNAKAGVEAARVANKSSVQHSGQFGASHGAMGQKIPFIIIRNPIQVKVVNYNDDYGYPAHKRVIVGGCTGYLRVREVNVISAHATDDEKAAIEALLKNGVYVS